MRRNAERPRQLRPSSNTRTTANRCRVRDRDVPARGSGSYLALQLKAAGVTQPLFDDTARQGLYQATKGIPRKVNKLAMTALRLAAARPSGDTQNWPMRDG